MPAAPYDLRYGKSTLRVSVPGDCLAPRNAAPIALRDGGEETSAVVEALENPIGTAPLRAIVRSGERVAIVVNDITRLTRTDLMLPPIVDTLNAAGIPDRDIFIVFALGIHRPQTEAERRFILGEALHARIRSFDHISTDDAALVEIGTTSYGNRVEINRQVWEADRIILTGEIIYHLIAGYSGGRKSLVPGVAGFRTTTFNHRMIFHPDCRSGLLDGNPAHEDLLEACRLADPDFLVNLVLSPEGQLIRVVAGHYDLAHREGCRTVDQMLRVDLDAPYDLIVASAGGFPLDIDLRQAHKGLDNACHALRPGGAILFYAECPNGAGIRSFEDYIRRYRDDFEMRQALERDFVVGGHKAWWVARLGRLYNVHLVSALDPDFVRRCHFTPVSPAAHESALAELLRNAGPAARIAVIPFSGFTLPAAAAARSNV
ncbi:MAG TPA: nickel-dependent lactate racemase [Bryobacteraceae bacterium]|nr:nickel-dependent lactate racemase [Bryobacteraceae bacterium]